MSAISAILLSELLKKQENEKKFYVKDLDIHKNDKPKTNEH